MTLIATAIDTATRAGRAHLFYLGAALAIAGTGAWLAVARALAAP